MNNKDEISISAIDDRLSQFAERHPLMLRWLSKIESSAVSYKTSNISIDRPIYICGIARSGTTILLEMLASHHDAGTHKYKDFPFVLTPIWWNWFIDKASAPESNLVERFHKDRIYITKESPEAIEEILWMNFFPTCHDPAVSNIIDGKIRYPKFDNFYKDHIRKILLLRSGKRYIAKNNYDIARLGYLKSLFADCRIIIMVRDPVNHIASLIKQHLLFCQAEQRDQRILNNMKRLGHFEFGLNRRPINVDDFSTLESILDLWDKGEEIHGFARLWASVYRYVLDEMYVHQELKNASFFVYYDDLCSSPFSTLERVYHHCELEIDFDKLHEQASLIKAPSYYTSSFTKNDVNLIKKETQEVHDRLRVLCNRAV